MEEFAEKIQNLLGKITIKIGKDIISDELLLKTYIEFLSKTMNKESHNKGLVLHTGSICFDAVSLVFAAITNMLVNKTKSDDIITSLIPGDFILYNNKRCIFDEICDSYPSSKYMKNPASAGQYVKVHQNDGTVQYIPETQWRLISPYNGDSKTADGRGIRKKRSVREDFYIQVLGFNKEDIPAVLDTSTVMVMPRSLADELLKDIKIGFGNTEASLLELATASYFTEDEEYRYSGNTGKNEPVLKICPRVSVASSIVKTKDGNNHIGVFVLGQESITRGETELPALLKRKSLQYVYLCASQDYSVPKQILEENDDLEVFACTKDFLLEHSIIEEVKRNTHIQKLKNQLDIIIDKDIRSVVFNKDLFISSADYKRFRSNILSLKRNQYESDDKNEFIMNAYSVMNLFCTAVFGVSKVDRAKEKGLIQNDTPKQKLEYLNELALKLPESLKPFANDITSILNECFERLSNTNPKHQWLMEFVQKNKNKKIAIIVPKAYYIPIIREVGLYSPIVIRNAYISTPAKFENAKIFDVIVCIGDFEGRFFNAFKTNSAKEVISLLYPFEQSGYSFRRKFTENERHLLEKRQTIPLTGIGVEEEIFEAEEIEANITSEEINEFISQLDSYVDISRFTGISTGSKGTLTTEIVAVATFTDDTKAFFTKQYKAYVLDPDTGNVKECTPVDLDEGDSIVFTKNNNETKDIVDSLVSQMIEDKKLSSHMVDSYHKSKAWQKSLIEYKNYHFFSAKEVAEGIINGGAPVQEITVRGWLDEDSHTVGPRDVNSLVAIGKLTGNVDIEENANVYFEACKDVRSLRRKVLSEIGKAIISKLNGQTVSSSSEFAEVYERIDSLSEVLQIEKIVETTATIPQNLTNRPISI